MRTVLGVIVALAVLTASLANAQAVTVGANCTISWAANTEADLASYRVYATLTPTGALVGPAKQVDIPKASTSTTCAALGLQTGGALTIQVDAVDLLGNRSPRSAAVTALQDIQGPAQPTGVTVTPHP